MKGKQHVLEMVPTLYFSVVTRDYIIIFGHKFLGMAQKPYVITKPGSLRHLSHGPDNVSKNIHFQPIKDF